MTPSGCPRNGRARARGRAASIRLASGMTVGDRRADCGRRDRVEVGRLRDADAKPGARSLHSLRETAAWRVGSAQPRALLRGSVEACNRHDSRMLACRLRPNGWAGREQGG